MPQINTPIIICRLTDKNGKLLNPYAPGAVTYTELCTSGKCPGGGRRAAVIISGYVVVYTQGNALSDPIPFRVRDEFCILAPKNASLSFQVSDFCCRGIPVTVGTKIGQVDITVSIKTIVRSYIPADISVLPIPGEPCAGDGVTISVPRVFGRLVLDSEAHAVCSLLLSASATQYSALSNGTKKNYADSDALIGYGSRGIPAPDSVSLSTLFINSVLQPAVNYTQSAGHLDLQTPDAPLAGQTVIATFVTFGKNHGRTVSAANDTCVFVSNGAQTTFYDTDELPGYSTACIPAPDGVSYFCLFVNGALQPEINYSVRAGVLELKTDAAPPSGAMIILQCLTVRDSGGTLLSADTHSYNALSNGGRIYTDRDELTSYGSGGISDPRLSSYLTLFVNGIPQPQVSYTVSEGVLTLDTDDAPIAGAPVTLQFVRVYLS